MARNVMFVEIHKIHLRSGHFTVSANKADGRFHSSEWAWDKAVSPRSQETGRFYSGPGNCGDPCDQDPLWLPCLRRLVGQDILEKAAETESDCGRVEVLLYEQQIRVT